MDRPPIGYSQKSSINTPGFPPDEFRYVYNRKGSASVVGEVFQADIGASQAETTDVTAKPDDITGPGMNWIPLSATAGSNRDIAPLGVAMEAVPDNALMKIQVTGYIAAISAINTGGAGAAVGTALVVNGGTAGALDTVVAAGNTRHVGWISTAHPVGAGAENVAGWFDGTAIRK